MRRWTIIAGAVLALAVIGVAAYYGYWASVAQAAPIFAAPETVPVELGDIAFTVTGPGISVDNGEASLEARVNGRVDTLTVRPGDRVTSGQVLVMLGDREDFEDAITKMQMLRLEAQQELDDLVTNAPKVTADAQIALLDAQEELKEAQITVDAMKYPRASQERIAAVNNDYQQSLQNVALAQMAYDTVLRMNLPEYDPRRIGALASLTAAQTQRDHNLGIYNWLTGKPSDADIAQAQAALRQAKAAADIAQQAYDQVKDGPGSTRLALVKAKVKDAEAQYHHAQVDLDNLTVKAPFDGQVLEVSARVGQSVADGTTLLTITSVKDLEIQVTVVEEDLSLIRIGQPCDLYFDAFPDQNIDGIISRIVAKRADVNKPVYTVFIQMKNPPKDLVGGMTVDASIVIDKKTSVLRLPRTAIRSVGNDKAEVEVWTGSATEKRIIQVGLRGDSYVEVRSGLEEGDQVVAR